MTSQHGYDSDHMRRIGLAFEIGGYVTVYEADAFLRLSRGATLIAVQKGLIPSRMTERGKHSRIVVKATDAAAVLGTKAKA